MRRTLAITVLLAFMPTAKAYGEIKISKADFSMNAEYRGRYILEKNPTGNANEAPQTLSTFNQRFKMVTNFRASEKISAMASLMHSANWGQQNPGVARTDGAGNTDSTGTGGSGDTALGVNNGTLNPQNLLLVHEAYGTWMASDDLIVRIGRQTFGFGDETIMSTNDWEQIPFSFDGVTAHYEFEAGVINMFGFKLAEFSGGTGNPAATPAPPATSSGSAKGDPEANLLGVTFDLKTRPEMLKAVNVYAFKTIKDTTVDNATDPTAPQTNRGMNTLNYGAAFGLGFYDFDFNVGYHIRTGDIYTPNKLDGSANMMHITTGYTAESWWRTRVGLVYHQDSGENTNDKYGVWGGTFHERHGAAGQMDLLDYGNLTFYGGEIVTRPLDSTSVGIAYLMFRKTDSATAITPGAQGVAVTTGSAATDEIGAELDAWLEYQFEPNFTTVARFGIFQPGDAINGTRGNNIMHGFFQAKMTF